MKGRLQLSTQHQLKVHFPVGNKRKERTWNGRLYDTRISGKNTTKKSLRIERTEGEGSQRIRPVHCAPFFFG